MTTTPRTAAAWSLSRWTVWIAALFTVQLSILWLVGERPWPGVRHRAFPTRISFEPGLLQHQAVAELPNPASLALPDTRGFSGEAWLKYAPPAHQFSEWTEPPQWLALSNYAVTFGSAAARFAAESRPPALRLADEALAWSAVAEPTVPPVPLPARSRLEIDNALLRDSSTPSVELPSWQTNEAVSNSVVRVAFDQAGRPFSCVLLGRSGLKEADDYALKRAKNLRFRPAGLPRAADAGTLHFGRLTFFWHTIPVPATPQGVTSLPTP